MQESNFAKMEKNESEADKTLMPTVSARSDPEGNKTALTNPLPS